MSVGSRDGGGLSIGAIGLKMTKRLFSNVEFIEEEEKFYCTIHKFLCDNDSTIFAMFDSMLGEDFQISQDFFTLRFFPSQHYF